MFNTIRKIIQGSDIIYTGVKVEELQIHGCIYDIFTGEIEWLGEHPDLEPLCQRHLPMHRWRNTHHTLIHDVKDPAVSERARRVITMLRQGNDRFCAGRWHYRTPCGLEGSAPPCAVVLGGSESRVPIEDLFDVEPGRLVVQRVLGSVAGLKERTAYSSIQYAVMRWKPPVLLVLVESSSAVVTAAIEELRGHYLPRAPVRAVLEHIMVSAQRAIRQVEEDSSLTAAGREIKAQRLTTELNCLYSMEMMLASKNIRDMVRTGEVELFAAIMETGTGKIRFIGPHPRQDDVIRAADLRERTYAAGPASILSREDWENYLPSWALVERRPFTADDAEPTTGATGSVGTTALLKPVEGYGHAARCGTSEGANAPPRTPRLACPVFPLRAIAALTPLILAALLALPSFAAFTDAGTRPQERFPQPFGAASSSMVNTVDRSPRTSASWVGGAAPSDRPAVVPSHLSLTHHLQHLDHHNPS